MHCDVVSRVIVDLVLRLVSALVSRAALELHGRRNAAPCASRDLSEFGAGMMRRRQQTNALRWNRQRRQKSWEDEWDDHDQARGVSAHVLTTITSED